jgi:hypothetical protein
MFRRFGNETLNVGHAAATKRTRAPNRQRTVPRCSAATISRARRIVGPRDCFAGLRRRPEAKVAISAEPDLEPGCDHVPLGAKR